MYIPAITNRLSQVLDDLVPVPANVAVELPEGVPQGVVLLQELLCVGYVRQVVVHHAQFHPVLRLVEELGGGGGVWNSLSVGARRLSSSFSLALFPVSTAIFFFACWKKVPVFFFQHAKTKLAVETGNKATFRRLQ